MKHTRKILARHLGMASLGLLLFSGCTTTSSHIVYKDDGIVVKHTELTDYGVKLSGHGSYILLVNSAVVYGKEYPIIAGNGICVLPVPDHKLLLFVCRVQNPASGFDTLDRELHVVNLQDRSDTVIPLGESKMGDDFGSHLPGSKFAAKVDIESDQRLRITTYNGRTSKPPIYQPTGKSVFLVSLSNKKLLSTSTP